jgi:hypothetical protein
MVMRLAHRPCRAGLCLLARVEGRVVNCCVVDNPLCGCWQRLQMTEFGNPASVVLAQTLFDMLSVWLSDGAPA